MELFWCIAILSENLWTQVVLCSTIVPTDITDAQQQFGKFAAGAVAMQTKQAAMGVDPTIVMISDVRPFKAI